MKIMCQRAQLAAGLQNVGGVVPTRTPKEILRNVKLHVADRKATLIATDQEVGIRYDLPEVEADADGDVLLPLQRLSAILREVTEDVVTIEATEDALRVRCGHSDFRLSISDPAEFPDVPGFGDEQYFSTPAAALKQAIQRTLFAADVESTRYALGGVLLDFNDQGLTLAATDSRRLAVCPVAAEAHGAAAAAVQPVVPSKAMSMIERSLGGEEPVKIAVHAHDVVVQSGLSTIYARLVQGRFPKYQDVVPRDSQTQIELVVGPLHSAVRQAMIVTNDESRGVDFRFQDGTLTLESQAADVGTSKVEMPIAYDGESIMVTFDPKFVADFLRVLEPSAAVTLQLNDPNSAAVFRADGSYTYVVMPLAPDR
ncbi:MAG: DNA polymerase III subunit beta [Planctomycetaceae bacterium]|nr:DNA polymerase III subunit beta [Planctomycetaceae bacterium]